MTSCFYAQKRFVHFWSTCWKIHLEGSNLRFGTWQKSSSKEVVHHGRSSFSITAKTSFFLPPKTSKNNQWISSLKSCKTFLLNFIPRDFNIKFRYSERATKFWKNIPIFLTLLSLFSNFVVFSECLNFKPNRMEN